MISADEATTNAATQLDETNRRLHTAIQQAQRFIVDEALESWVADPNVGKGINHVPGITLQETGQVKRRFGVDVPETPQGARQWMQRWHAAGGSDCGNFLTSKLWRTTTCMARFARRRGPQTKNKRSSFFCTGGFSTGEKQRPFFGRCFKAAYSDLIRRGAQKTAAVFLVSFFAPSAPRAGESNVALE